MVAPVSFEKSPAETRQALLEAAAGVFAEAGYQAATVREICLRAGANIASVNYHFGDKEKLYLEVFRYTQRLAFEKYPPDFGLQAGASPEARLKAYIRSFLSRIFDEGPIAWHGRLMAREMIEPTRVLDTLVEERMRPQADLLMGIIRELLGPKTDRERIRLCGFSVVSQCLFFHHCRPALERLFPEQKFSLNEMEKLATHITEFSLAALKPPATRKNKRGIEL